MNTARVEKAEKGKRSYVSGITDAVTAQLILKAIVAGFTANGYARSNDETDKRLPEGLEILRGVEETVAFRVVAA